MLSLVISPLAVYLLRSLLRSSRHNFFSFTFSARWLLWRHIIFALSPLLSLLLALIFLWFPADCVRTHAYKFLLSYHRYGDRVDAIESPHNNINHTHIHIHWNLCDCHRAALHKFVFAHYNVDYSAANNRKCHKNGQEKGEIGSGIGERERYIEMRISWPDKHCSQLNVDVYELFSFLLSTDS